jgi:hypothetical protein
MIPARIIPLVVLKNKETGDRFYTNYDGDYNHWAERHEILGFANTDQEVEDLWPTKENFRTDMMAYLASTFAKMDSLGVPLSREGKQQAVDLLLEK